jgi:hypothetical protein
MKPNWGMIGIFLTTLAFWYSVFTNGFFISVLWLIIFSAIVVLILRLKGEI